MECTAICSDSFLEWSQAFCETTGLGPKEAALIYSELCNLKNVETLMRLLVQRDEALSDYVHQNISDQYTSIIESECDEKIDSESLEERHEWYSEVLDHHGFDLDFIQMFLKNLSPTSDLGERYFEYAKKASVKDWYIRTPYAYKDKRDEQEYLKEYPLNPEIELTQWQYLFRNIGFKIFQDRQQPDIPCSGSSFSVGEEHRINAMVYLADVSKYPFEADSDRVTELKKRALGIRAFLPEVTIILLWSNPTILRKPISNESVVFYGQINYKDTWSEMPLNPKTRNIKSLINDIRIVGDDFTAFINRDWSKISDNELMTIKTLLDWRDASYMARECIEAIKVSVLK
jgi:hypothetical protein